MAVCARCADLVEVREASDRQLLTLARIERSDPERALQILDDLRRDYRDRDHDGWLDRSVRAHRADIFTWNDRYDEALSELRELRQILRPGSREYAENQHAIAFALNRSGNPTEALHELDLSLAHCEHLPVGTVESLLALYARIADKDGRVVPDAYRSSFDRVIDEWGIPVPLDLVRSDFTRSILVAVSQYRGAQDRYDALLEGLRGRPPDARARLLREFIEAEPFGFFRDMAKRSLDGGDAEDGTGHGG